MTRIQNRLGVTDSHLTVREIDEVLPEIEAKVIDLIPDYATKKDNAKVYLGSAVVCLCASALCSVLKKKFPVKEQGPSGSFETPIDWNEEEVRLEVLGKEYLAKIKPPTYCPLFHVR